jgi:hypothetical protein
VSQRGVCTHTHVRRDRCVVTTALPAAPCRGAHVATFVAGDDFGGGALSSDGQRHASVVTTEPTIVLSLRRHVYESCSKALQQVRPARTRDARPAASTPRTLPVLGGMHPGSVFLCTRHAPTSARMRRAGRAAGRAAGQVRAARRRARGDATCVSAARVNAFRLLRRTCSHASS